MAWKIPWYSIGRFTLIVLCLAIVLALVVVILPIYLDVTAFKGPIEEILTDFAGAPVRVDEARLHPSLWPTLVVSGVEMAGARGENSPLFSRIDRVELKVALLPLLRKQIQLKRLFVSGATLHAHRPEGKTGNWPVWTSTDFEISELAGIELEDITLHLEDHDTVTATAVIDGLSCDIARRRPLDLNLVGSFEDLPLTLSASGPTLAVPLSQASDFPLLVQMALADLQLGLDGTASREPGGTKFQFSFALKSNDLGFLRQLGGIDLPEVGGFDLAGQLSNRDGAFEVAGLKGSIGSTSVRGGLALDLSGARPLIRGRLYMGQLDLEPWMGGLTSQESDTSTRLPASLLSAANADLVLALRALTGLETTVEDLTLEVSLDNGFLSVPLSLRAAGVPLTADLKIRSDIEKLEVRSRVSARDVSLRELDRIVDIPDALDGHLGSLDLDFTSSGNSLDSLAVNLLVEAHAKESAVSILNEAGDERIELFLSQAHATHRPGEPLVVVAEGNLLEEAFALDLETAPVANLIANDTWPLNLQLQGAGATLDVRGSLEKETTGLGFDFEFDLSGERLGDLNSWLGVPPQADLSYRAKGRLTSAAGTSLLRLDDFHIGSTQLTGEFARNTENEAEPFMVDLRASTLELGELQGLSDSMANLDAENDVIGMDMPILPSKVSFHDAEIELVVDRLLRKPVDLTDVSATLSLRQGRLLPSPFSFSYGTERFTGQINLDLRQEVPYFALELHGRGDELGQILEREEIVEEFEVAAKQLDLKIEGSGASVREIIHSSELTGQMIDLRWQFQPPEFDEPLTVQLDRVDLSGPKGEPLVLSAAGHLDQVPIELRLDLRVPQEIRETPDQAIPFRLSLHLAATSIELLGEVELPLKDGEFDVQMVVEGTTVATLSALVDMDLPDIGPYRLASRAALEEGGFSLRDLDLVLGESDLTGEIRYKRVDGRPLFSADLTGQLIRTQDIFKSDRAADGETDAAEELVAQKEPTVKSILDILNGFDATVDLAIRETSSSHGSMKNMVVDLDLELGGLDLLLKRSQESDDDAELAVRVRPSGEGVEAKIRAHWAREPYGMFADLVSPGSADGSWSLDTDLESRGSTLREISANLSGHFNLASYPVDSKATFLDLWGGGLLTSLLPVFQIGEESRVNCSVVKLQADQGVLKPERLIIDSTRTRITGKGTIDLPANKVRLSLKPRPKKRNLINLSTPVKIRGSLNDPDVRISTGGVAVTFFRLSLWAYTVWRDLARRPLPGDGQDVCADPFATRQKKRGSTAPAVRSPPPPSSPPH